MAHIMRDLIYKKIDPSDAETMKKIYRLRYQVYGHECGFINPDDYPLGLEQDEYDEQSVHFAALNPDGDVLGTVRLILSGSYTLPIKKHCTDLPLDFEGHTFYHFGEVSRLLLDKRLRHGKEFLRLCEMEERDTLSPNAVENSLCMAKCVTIGLCSLMFAESARRGVTHWYALMEHCLWMLFRLYGFHFRRIGGPVDVFGPVHPYLVEVDVIERSIIRFLSRHNCPLLQKVGPLSTIPQRSFAGVHSGLDLLPVLR